MGGTITCSPSGSCFSTDSPSWTGRALTRVGPSTPNLQPVRVPIGSVVGVIQPAGGVRCSRDRTWAELKPIWDFAPKARIFSPVIFIDPCNADYGRNSTRNCAAADRNQHDHSIQSNLTALTAGEIGLETSFIQDRLLV